jgi:glycosyltransferase involved in cell wall biosynthesis
MLGSVHDMPAFYRGIDVLCFPSVREGLPNAVIEAAACGVPTVAWNATGLPDAIVNNETGFLVPIGDVAAMTERLVTILSSDAERSRLSRSARAFVERSFEANHVQGLFVRDLAVLLGD